MNLRIIKTAFGFLTSIYLLLVVFNNISDYQTNFQFVSHVTSMDSLFNAKTPHYRSIHNPALHHFFYISIIFIEMLIAGLCLAGSVRMFQNLRAAQNLFDASKKWLVYGLAAGVTLWFGIFISIAGEWFLMWQSETWNGQQTAFFLTITFLLFLLFILQKEEHHESQRQ